jgi:hypothetical protein
MSNYDNLDYRLNILYDFVYNDNTNVCYKFKPISLSEISFDKIKMNNKILEKNVFSEEIKYIGKINNKYHFKRLSKTHYPCTITVGIYKDKNDINNMMGSENINILNTYVLSEIIANENNKFVILPIANFDLSFGELSDYSSIIANEIKKNNKITNDTMVYINITEHYFSMDTLYKFLIENNSKMTLKHWKSLFFQILFILYKITNRLKQFRHNNLNLNSIWVYKRKDIESIKEFNVNNIKFEVPIYNFEIKIMDFENSTSLDIPNKKKKSDNPYFDIHYFFQNIIFIYNELENIPNEIKKFIDEIIPEIFRYKNKNEFNGLDELLYEKETSIILNSSLILKKNNFFTEFIKENMDSSISPMSNNIKNINQYNIKENGINYSISASEYSNTPRMLGKKNKSMTGSRKIKSKSKSKSNKKSHSILENAEKFANRRSSQVTSDDVYSPYEKKLSHSSSKKHMKKENDDSNKNLKNMKRGIVNNSKSRSSTVSMSNSEDSKDIPEMSMKSDVTIKSDNLKALSNLLNKAKELKLNKHNNSEDSLDSDKINKKQENNLPSKLQNNILGNLPPNYNGALPEHYEKQLAAQGALNMNNPMMSNPMMNPMMNNPMSNPMMNPMMNNPMNNPMMMGNTETKFNNNPLALLGGPAQTSLPTNFNNSLGSAGMNNSLGSAGMNNSLGSAGMNNSLGSIGMNNSLGSIGMNNSLGSTGMNNSLGAPNLNMGSLNEQGMSGVVQEQTQIQQTGGNSIKKYRLKNTDDFFF